MHANRRRQCESWSKTLTTAYSYRFNAQSSSVPPLLGSTHFEEVAFVLNNIAGLGYHGTKPFTSLPKSYINLSLMMASMWASFIHDLNPNNELGDRSVHWHPYSEEKPVNLLLDANTGSHMENDTWRGDGIKYINEAAHAFWR
jgi:triacylglycerol lipase